MTSIPQAPPTSTSAPTNQQDQKPQVDPVRLQMFMQRLRSEQNLSAGIMAGIGAAVAGSVVWAIVTALTGYQIGWMAIGIGFVVGLAMRKFGQGIDQSFGFAGAGLALFGCMLGNLLTVCILISQEFGVGYMEVLGTLDGATVVDIMAETFQIMDLLFYGIAMWAGYKYSIRALTDAEARMLAGQA